MDQRTELRQGAHLAFPGMDCVIVKAIGRGANAIVYEGEYRDATSAQRKHRVLIKELFPFDPDGHIWRDGQQRICRDDQGETAWSLHRHSFERGNSIHLQLLTEHPDQTGGNLNTFALNQTLYTLLDYSGGRSLDKALHSGAPQPLPLLLLRMRKLLLALSALHDQGLLHLDISLDNVLLVGQGELERVLLIDYNSVHSRAELLEQSGIYFSAKEGFTAPEVRMGMVDSIGPCTDLFSAACVFYAMLTGSPPTAVQLARRLPPDASDSPLLRDAPATVKAQLAAILRRGLCVLPDRRYRSCAAMLRDLQELERRLAGVGVTHAALWEAGRRGVQRLIRQNPSLCYVESESGLYPLRIQAEDGASMPAQAWIDATAGEGGASSLLSGEGGMGKSTVLLRAALSGTSRYSPARPAVMYLSLMGRKHGESRFILDQILMELRFDARTRTIEDARHALIALLNPAQGQKSGRPVLLLLLDGLNEATGDTSALLGELRQLSGYSALRMVIATRTVPQGLPLPRAVMVPLQESDLTAALTAHGLLLPEGAGMRQLLRTPMMLSLFIQTAKSAGRQVQCQSQSGLIDGYLDALCRKAAQERGCEVDYRVEAAVRLVLPAIAHQIRRQGRPLNDQALYRVVMRCHRVLHSRALCRAFPQWIGHSREALGDGAQSAEAWHGEIVQRILWQQLGLLVRSEDGCYHILHQILQEHLIRLCSGNRRRLRKGRTRALWASAAAVFLAACAGLLLSRPAPKALPDVLSTAHAVMDTTMSSMVMDALTTQYVNCGQQYEAMRYMLSGSMTPDACAERVARLNDISVTQTARMTISTLKDMGADIIPWSGQPFGYDTAEALIALPAERQQEYVRYIQAYQLILEGRASTTKAEFSSALSRLLEADADVAWLLQQQSVAPHVEGMSDQQRLAYNADMSSLPVAQEYRPVDTSLGLSYALEKARETRYLAQNELSRMSVMHGPARTATAEKRPQQTASPVSAEAADATSALLTQLDAYLSVCEQMFAVNVDVLRSTSDFCQQLDYTSLLKARIAADQAQKTLEGMTLPTLSLSDDAMSALMAMGVETDALEAEMQTLSSSVTERSTCMCLYESLLSSALLHKDCLSAMRLKLNLDQQSLALEMQYTCALVNYLLLPAADQAQASAFWASIPQRYPTLGSTQTDWESDGSLLITRASELLDHVQSLLDDSAALLGWESYTVDQIDRTLQDNDPDALKASVVVIDGMPTMAPLPADWLYPETSVLSIGGEASDSIPEVITVREEGVAMTSFNRYIELLLSCGAAQLEKEGSEGEGWRYSLLFRNHVLSLQWSPTGTAAVRYQPALLSLESLAYIRFCQ